MMLISYSTFSQTTKDSITISVSQARKIAKDLAYLPIVIQENDLLKLDTTRYKFIIEQKDSLLTYRNQQIDLLDTVITNQKYQLDISLKEKNTTVSQIKWLKIERIGLAALVIFLGGYAIGKP